MRKRPMAIVIAALLVLHARPVFCDDETSSRGLGGRRISDVAREYTPARRAAMPKAAGVPKPPEPPKPPKIVSANVFVATDEDGNVRVEMAGAGNKGGQVRLFDAHGTACMELSEHNGVTRVALLDEDGRSWLALRYNRGGSAELTLGEPTANHLHPITLSAGRRRPALTLRSAEGKKLAHLHLHDRKGGRLEVTGPASSAGISPGTVSLWTPGGGPHASLSMPNENRAMLNLSSGGQTKTRMELGCAGTSSWATLQTDDHGSVHLAAKKDNTFLTLRPAGGEGEAHLSSRLKDGRTWSSMHLSDGGGIVQIQLDLRDDKPKLRMVDNEGMPAFYAP